MAITGPKLQMPNTLADIFSIDKEANIISMKPEWATFFNTLQKTVFANTRAGSSSERPTSLMTGRYLGMPFYDQTLSSVIFLISTNPDKWQVGAAATWGNIVGVLSNQTDLINALNAKAATSTLAGVATSGAYGSLSGTPTLGTAASTAASTYALATVWASSAAQTTISLGLNTFSTATTISLSTGTWMLNAQILVGMNGATTETHFTAQLTDGTNNLAQGQQSVVPTLASSYASIPLGCIVKYGAPSTVSLQAAGDITGGFIRGWPWQNATGSTATMIQALKLA
jgi:hypothetical protein